MGSLKPKGAYACIITTDSYAIGAKVLAWSLSAAGSAYPLIILYTPETLSSNHIDDLRKLGCDTRETTRVDLHQETNFAFASFSEVWTKLRVFGLIDYDRIVLLDADMLVRQNLDELMTMELPDGWIAASHGCKCNLSKLPSYPPEWNPSVCAYTNYKKGTVDEICSKTSTSDLDYFNTGLLVLKPSLESLEAMVKTLISLPDLTKYHFGDQDFLNEVYKEKWISLSYKYNALKTLRDWHSPVWDDDEIKIVHYIIGKPWSDLSWAEKPEVEQKKDAFYVVNTWWFQAYKLMTEGDDNGEKQNSQTPGL